MKQPKLFQNRNFIIIAALVVIIAAILVLSILLRPAPSVSADARQIEISSDGEAALVTADALTAPAYVLCTLPSGGQYGIIPLPSEGEVSYPIHQTFTDGTQVENILHLTPEGFSMEFSTCKNQNCVQQGEVTLENREERVLQNCVICLPNQVMAELYTAEEIAEMDLAALREVPSEE